MGRFAYSMTVTAGGSALGALLSAAPSTPAQTESSAASTVKVRFGSGVEIQPTKKDAKPLLLSKEKADVLPMPEKKKA